MDDSASIPRCSAVWLLVTSAVGGLVTWLAPDLREAARVATSPGRDGAAFDQLLAVLAAAVVCACGAWIWVVTTVVAVESARGRPPEAARLVRGCPAGLRRLLFAACGVALGSALAAPATAAQGQHENLGPATMLAGLPLPERAAAQPSPAVITVASLASPPGSTQEPRHEGHRDRSQTVRVVPGDTLWGLASSTLPAGAAEPEIARRWRAIYRHNRDVIGADPDLILPGITLSLPEGMEDPR